MSQDFPPQDPLATIKNLWAQAGLPFPAAVMPLDADALDRKIAELKAVQLWLQSNLSMLQGSIQFLEMQKAGAQAMQSGAPQAIGEAWLKFLQDYQQKSSGETPDKKTPE